MFVSRSPCALALATGLSQGARGGGGLQVSKKMSAGEPLVAAAGAERGVHVMDAGRWSVIKRWPTAIKFEITMMELSATSPDHCFLAGFDYELICGCWSRQSIAGGFAFRGDSRWLGLARADGVSGGGCLLYTSPSPRDATLSRMPSSA